MFSIPGEPIAQKRPRLFKRGAHTMVYNPNHHDKQRVSQAIMEQYIQHANSDSKEIVMKASKLSSAEVFYVAVYLHSHPPVKNATKAFKNRINWGLVDKISKPDVDNCVKFILDACNSVLFDDDSRVVTLYVQKQYSYEPRTEIYIMGKKQPASGTIRILEMLPPTFLADWAQTSHLASSMALRDPIEEQSLAIIIYEFAKKYAMALSHIAKIKEPKFDNYLR